MKQESFYTPGVCNINEIEVGYRKRAGHAGVGMFVIMLLIFVIIKVDPVWTLVLYVPAFLAAIGYLQAKKKFCVSYAASGVYNSSSKYADTTKIVEAVQRKLDRNRARKMNFQAMGMGLLATAASYYLLLALP